MSVEKRYRKVRAVGLLALLALSFVVALVQPVNAIGCHYAVDKPYYHPGETGTLTLSCQNDGFSDSALLGAEVNIHGIGVFKWDMSNIPEDRKIGLGPENTPAYLWKQGETVNIAILFDIPADARPQEYEYTWTIYLPSKTMPTFAKTDTLRVYPTGEKPPPELPNPFFILLILVPILLVAYPVARWRSRKAAKLIGIAIVVVLALCILLGGFLFLYLVFSFVTTLFPVLILLVLAMLVVGFFRRRRGAQSKRTCTDCGKNLSQFPVDIKNCPYCGKAISAAHIEVPQAPTRELLASAQRTRRYAKIVALSGLAFGLACLILGPFLGGLLGPDRTYMFPILHEYQNTIGYGVIVGFSLAIVSGIARAIAGMFKKR